jgi:DNA-binding NtrC family response regulator
MQTIGIQLALRSRRVTETRILEDRRRGLLVMPGTRLLVVSGPDRGRFANMTHEELLVGASLSANLQLSDPTVSRLHLSVRATEDGYLLTDLESTNGTFIGKCRLKSGILAPNEAIDIGHTRLRLEALGQPVDLPLSQAKRLGGLVGGCTPMRRMFALLERIATESVSVLIHGESGAGKDAVAEAIHSLSPRAKRPFVVVDCAALTRSLVESELFGHVRGAFTGADRDRVGAFEEAEGGTVYIDHINDLPVELQAKLLRVIERREVRPLGSVRARPVDVRVLAATTADLRIEVNQRRFREDLFYRLNVFSIRVPPLRERRADIPLLVEHFKRAPQDELDDVDWSQALRAFLSYDWPGNVRELRNRVELLQLRAEEALCDLPSARRTFRESKRVAVERFEREFIEELMASAKGNVSEAARLAAMDRPYLIKLLRKHRAA